MPPSENPSLYVFDAACLIELERSRSLSIVADLGERAIVPRRVEREVSKPGTLLERWLGQHRYAVKRFVPGSQEEQAYYELTRDNGPRLGDGEAAAIAVALNRGAVLVTDDRAAIEAAENLGIACMTTNEFLSAALL